MKSNLHPGEAKLLINSVGKRGAYSPKRAPHKLKQILVPIGFSDCSRKALRHAVRVVREREQESLAAFQTTARMKT